MRKYNLTMGLLTLLMIILVSFSASCDKRNPAPILPTVAAPPPVSDIRIITRITATPNVIYSDYNITYSNISVEVKDGEGFGVLNQIVKFKSYKKGDPTTRLGRVLTDVPTDSTGIAETTFWDDGDVGIATIEAVVRKFHATVTDSLVSCDTTWVDVEIKPIPPISSVNLRFPSELQPYPMNVMQTANLVAIPTNDQGNSVPNNTLVAFNCTKGRFIDTAGNELGRYVIASTFNGQASVRYSSWTDATTAPGVENAFVSASIGGVSDTKEVVVRPGRPANIDLFSFVEVDGEMVPADTSSVGSPNHIFMKSTLSDIYGNFCPSQQVKFTTDLGSFMNTTQSAMINTAADGVAQVRFTPGLSAGAANVKAAANGDTLQVQTIFMVTSTDLYSISFTQSDQINLNVANTGGLQSAILRVKLRDINGNLIDSPQNIYFMITNSNAPEGANLNNAPQSDSVLVISNGGEAQISVNSGTESGMLKIRASWVNDDNTSYIFSLKTNIVIHAGPPSANGIIPSIGGFNSGTNIGGGMWRVIVGAVVKDIHNNPVDKGTAVWFEILNEPNCQIAAEAYVGNVSANGDSIAGTAYTILTYNGVYTYDVITIRANCGDDIYGNPVFGDSDVVLPLNDPRFEIQAQPAALNFNEEQTTAETSNILCVLTDGQGLNVEGAIIMLLSTRGQFVQNENGLYDPTLPPNEWWKVITDVNGLAQGRIACKAVEVPLPDPVTETPGTTDVLITGRIMGTNVQANTSITLFRYPGNTAPW
ncbi:MAG: hypothetical protein PHO32_03770 [Candidatus Cloacimonetes bacterium]|nr:hypothetical protein [Candidatus Cloacimonadota bacterium]